MQSRSIIAVVYAWFTTAKEARRVLGKLKKEYCCDLTVQTKPKDYDKERDSTCKYTLTQINERIFEEIRGFWQRSNSGERAERTNSSPAILQSRLQNIPPATSTREETLKDEMAW